MTTELLAELTRLSKEYPDLRLCQLIANAIPTGEIAKRNNDIYYIEDAQLLEWLRTYEARMLSAAALLNDDIGSTV